MSPSKKVVGSNPGMVLSQCVSGSGQIGGEVAVVEPQGPDLPNKGCRWATCLCPRHRQATEASAGCWAVSVAQATVAVCCEQTDHSQSDGAQQRHQWAFPALQAIKPRGDHCFLGASKRSFLKGR